MTEQSVFDAPKPALTEARIADLLRVHWGVSGKQSALVSERDQNVLIDTGPARLVLKIANRAEDVGFLALQNAALAHVALTDPDLGVPRLVPALSGDGMVQADGHALRLMTWLPGRLWSSVTPDAALLRSLGQTLGRLSRALQGFGHPAAHRPGFLWNLDEVATLRPWTTDVQGDRRDMVARIFDRHAARVAPKLQHLRGAVVHQDANDNNLVVDERGRQVTGLIDFGDMTFGRQINELAVALAYALLDCENIYATALPVISAYAAEFPLDGAEAEVLFDLVAARLAASVCISSHRAKDHPDNAYLTISQAPAFRLLDRLDRTNPAFLAAFARHAAGLAPVPAHAAITDWLASHDCNPAQLFDLDLNRAGRFVLSLQTGAAGMEHAGDPVAHWAWLEAEFAKAGASFAVGLYGEVRDVYRGDQFRTPASPEWRAQHLGIDIFIAADTRLYAPLPGRVVSVVDNAAPYDYGPTVILEHRTGAGLPFWTLYGHLSRATLTTIRQGQEVQAGDLIGFIGDHHVNGGWSPHLHFQIMTDLMDLTGEYPGVGQPSLWPVWSRLVPDPNLILRLSPETFVIDPDPPKRLMARRAQVIGPSLSVSYAKKLKIVRGKGAYLFDHTGRAYVDAVNNIAHVGHAHPAVTEALARQSGILNTNTRYLHNTLLDYAERLGATFPAPLSVVYMVTSGSEANDLALRIARTVTGRHGIVTLDWAYHGHTETLIDVSPYKFKRKGGRAQSPLVEVAALPDPFRSKSPDADAADVQARIQALIARGHPPAAMIAEAISGCGGQVFFPKGYLAAAAVHIRAAGGLMIVDEVQTGFGRIGSHFWAHSAQGVVPDIVTLGKPIGNGHPMAAVITTSEIARAFANGMEFFSSFGGNPVSAAVGMAVMDVIEREGLQDRARITGGHLLAGLRALQGKYPLIGDVRGQGLFLGVELVSDPVTLEPATAEAGAIANAMREAGVLISTDGPSDNVLKIKPPMVFGVTEADLLLDALNQALAAVGG